MTDTIAHSRRGPLPDMECYGEDEVRAAELPERSYRIEGMLPLGLTVLVAPPKIGKSWIAQQIEHFLSAGLPFLGRPAPAPVNTLVIDLEGDAYLTRERSLHLAPDLAPERFARIVYVHRGRLPEGGFLERAGWLDDELRFYRDAGYPIGHVRVDTLRDFIGSKNPGENAYDSDKGKVTRLNQLALRYDVSLLALHHTNNSESTSDRYDAINGSTGAIMGGAACAWILSRPQRARDGVLHGVGRSVRDFELALEFAEGRWRVSETITASQARRTGTPRAVLDLLQDDPGATRARLEAVLTDHSASAINSALHRLQREGDIVRWDSGYYLAGTQPGAGEPAEQVELELEDRAPAPTSPAPAPRTRRERRARPDDPYAALIDSVKRTRVPTVLDVRAHERRMPWTAAAVVLGGAHRWRAELEDDDGRGDVLELDRRGSFPSAMSSVPVAGPELEHYGPMPDGPARGLAGIYRVQAPAWEDRRIGHPLGWLTDAHRDDDGAVWLTDPHVRLLRRLELEAPILDAWVGPSSEGLFRRFSEWCATERDRLADQADELAELKVAIGRAVQMLHATPEGAFWRPDWLAAVKAEARVRHWLKAWKATELGVRVLALQREDEVHVQVAAGGDVPAPFEVGPRFGQVSLKRRVSLEQWRADA